jgi:selenocysteine lyase/cysteine desulfurase
LRRQTAACQEFNASAMTSPEPGTGAGYFLYHSIGLFPDKARRVAAALSALATLWSTPDDGQWPASLDIRAQFIERWRQCIGAARGTLTTAENVTSALYSLIGSLPDRHLAGRRLLIAADCFPSLHFLLAGMAERRQFTLDTVPMRDGETWVRDEDFIARWGPDVGVALLTHVTSTTSHRCDLSALAAHGRAVGSLVGVDITQGVGIVPFDVNGPEVDFVVSTSLKWLCGVAGAGVLYVREGLLRECRPELRGWFSQENFLSWGLDSFAYAPDARRFDHGTPSILSCAASLPALEWHAAQSRDALVAHNQQLAGAMLDAAPSLGLTLTSPPDAAQRGGSVMFRLPASANPQSVISALRLQHLYADCRGTTLRVSPGNLTSMEGMERLVRALAISLR